MECFALHFLSLSFSQHLFFFSLYLVSVFPSFSYQVINICFLCFICEPAFGKSAFPVGSPLFFFVFLFSFLACSGSLFLIVRLQLYIFVFQPVCLSVSHFSPFSIT